jgi:hypothetical protein
MKKGLITAVIMLLTIVVFAQNSNVKANLKSIEGQYTVDDNGDIVYMRVIEVADLDFDEIYNRAHSYFTYNYVSGDDVIQMADRDAGIIVGKGIFPSIYQSFGFVPWNNDVYHILRVDIKEGKARVILSLTDYRLNHADGDKSVVPIKTHYPFEGNVLKNVMGNTFYNAHNKALETIDEIEKTIKQGNTSFEKSDEW